MNEETKEHVMLDRLADAQAKLIINKEMNLLNGSLELVSCRDQIKEFENYWLGSTGRLTNIRNEHAFNKRLMRVLNPMLDVVTQLISNCLKQLEEKYPWIAPPKVPTCYSPRDLEQQRVLQAFLSDYVKLCNKHGLALSHNNQLFDGEYIDIKAAGCVLSEDDIRDIEDWELQDWE